MSVIDLLFNEGPRSLDILLSGNDTRADLSQKIHSSFERGVT
jgi:hypothetical protein